jgi:hypothetical protein
MTHWEFSHVPFEGDLTDDKIVCQNCGWSWKVKDGGDDLYVCHKCGYDNSNFYLTNKEVYSNAVDPNAIIQGVSSLASLGGSIAQAKASKEMSKSELEKEISIVCGKRRPKLNKNKKAEYDSCVKSIRGDIDLRRTATQTQVQEQARIQQEQRQLLLKVNDKKQKNKTNLIIGVITLILGDVIYKKMNK